MPHARDGAVTGPAAPVRPASRRALVAWGLFDWANSAYPTVIVTFVFAAYYTQGVAADAVSGTAAWGRAISLSGLAVALTAPFLGAIADQGGRRKPWLAALSLLCIAASAGLWWVRPEIAWAGVALALVVVGNFAFESSMVFYNAMMPSLAPPERQGRLSGWAWGAGFAGGLGCLVVALVGFVQTETPWFGIGTEAAANVRAIGPLVALWFLVFGLPLFLFTPDRPAVPGRGAMAAIRGGVRHLWRTLRRLPSTPAIARFLVARMIYTDGLLTLFAFGGVYASGVFGFSLAEVIQFGIALNVTAGLGAVAFAWIDDAIGPKPTIAISLICLIVFGGAILLTESVTWFWVFGLALGVFIGPAQAASRSFLSRLVGPDEAGEYFGLFALSGKATAFLGPAVLAAVTDATGSQRLGMATILAFFAAGLALLLTVRAGGRPGT